MEYGLENISSYELGRGTAWFDMGTVNSFTTVRHLLKQFKKDKDYSYVLLMKLHSVTRGLQKMN